MLILAWNEYLLALFLSTRQGPDHADCWSRRRTRTRGPQWWYMSVLIIIMIAAGGRR